MAHSVRLSKLDFDEVEAVLLTQLYLDRQEDYFESSDSEENTRRTPHRFHRKSKSESFAWLDSPSQSQNDLKRSSMPAPLPPPLPPPPLPPTQYRYKSLRSPDDIRLISISTSQVDDELYFQLTRQNRNDCPPYEAISYTWGSTNRSKTIYHAFSGQTLAVTENCEAALRSLHQKGKPRLFWLDAVSINQDDIEERSHQVSIMDDVFRNAARTVAYLGPEDDHTLALTRWPEIRRLTEGYNEAIFARVSLEAFRHVEALLTRPWFTRTWVIQEVLLSKILHLQAGSHILDFSEICELLQSHGTTRRRGLGIMDTFIRYGNESSTKARLAHRRAWLWRRSASGRMSALQFAVPSKGYLRYDQIFDLLAETAAYQCRDPRDKLYALISLFDGEPPAELKPDYSLEIEDVYANISRYLLYSESQTFTLSAAHGVTGFNSLPSWVVDWRTFEASSDLLHNEAGECTRYQTGVRSDCLSVPILHSYGRTLRLRGIRVASIHLKLQQTKEGDDRLPLRGTDSRELKELVWYTRKDFHPPQTTFAYHLPAKTWPLDIICVFLGFTVPFVLRQSSTAWQLIGECNVEEIMYGQALRGVDLHEADAQNPVWPMEDFDLI